MDFDHDTAVNGGAGDYSATLHERWQGWGPVGGYMAAIALRAAGKEARLRLPLSCAVHYLRTPQFGRVDLRVDRLHAGRTTESFTVIMTQANQPVLVAMVRTKGDFGGTTYAAETRPVTAPFDKLISAEEIFGGQHSVNLWANVEVRPADRGKGWLSKPEEPAYRGWYRLRSSCPLEDTFLNAGRILLMADIAPFNAARYAASKGEKMVAPSLDLAVYFAMLRPHDEWLLADVTAAHAVNGVISTEIKIWSADGDFIASGTSQLLHRPPR